MFLAPLLALALVTSNPVAAQAHKPGSFEDGGNTLVSAMMVSSFCPRQPQTTD